MKKQDNIIKRTLVSGAVYHDFNSIPIFKGKYISDVKNEEGDIIGFKFIDLDNEEWLITNAYSIEKALNTIVDEELVKDIDCILEITFHGKSKSKKSGREFNRFSVIFEKL